MNTNLKGQRRPSKRNIASILRHEKPASEGYFTRVKLSSEHFWPPFVAPRFALPTPCPPTTSQNKSILDVSLLFWRNLGTHSPANLVFCMRCSSVMHFAAKNLKHLLKHKQEQKQTDAIRVPLIEITSGSVHIVVLAIIVATYRFLMRRLCRSEFFSSK